MRRAIFAGSSAEGRALLARARAIHLAMVSEAGLPILRTVNAVVLDDAIAFHGAPAGEKMEGLDRPVVVSAEETVATIPSWFLDPERACPATTLYVSAQVHGTLREVTDPARKARVLQALMEKYQPEGGHRPIDAEHPLYAKAVRGLLVAEVSLENVDYKEKLGQNRTEADRLTILEKLWQRGEDGDVRAITRVVSRFPELPRPAFLRCAIPGIRLQCWVDEVELVEARALLEDAYWLQDIPAQDHVTAMARSPVRVGARDTSGKLVAFARALSDERRVAWIFDVVVDASLRKTGVGSAIMELLLDHPAVRRARRVRLATRDAMEFYRRKGFCELAEAPRPGAWSSVEMVRTNA
ncbi:Histone acetyltransferase HPA2 [Labilithrix luteola]|uniref:Histone acetyltransferase HPA2 n=1 Tax=Labilithrix luteola TaxID=1391654 RepID=A0A0K1QB76_9BACT|nr:GNAT family N-acetyltransferase [Labilithrix luteola]AKV03041.1 Histone acetyltransferase HPA2 [Labilithrix luteola]